MKWVATSKNPELPNARQVKIPNKRAAPIPDADNPNTRTGDPIRNMSRLLAMAELHVGGEVLTRSRAVLRSPVSWWSGKDLGGGSIVETLRFWEGIARVLGAASEGEERRGRVRGDLGRLEANEKAIWAWQGRNKGGVGCFLFSLQLFLLCSAYGMSEPQRFKRVWLPKFCKDFGIHGS